MTADLSALIARLEAAEVGSRELDLEICNAMGVFAALIAWKDGSVTHGGPAYTTSLDAALALAERLPGWVWNMGNDTRCWAHLWNDLPTYDGNPSMGRAATPALALCIAILRAKQGGKT